MTLTKTQLDDFNNLAWDISGEVYEDYSGRGMFGKSCMGITVENVEKAIFLLGKWAAENETGFTSELERFQTDSMGRSSIIYFPKIQKQIDGE